jgi:hypothetical protein
MAVFAGRVRNWLGLLFVGTELCACSFVFEPPPGSPHELRPQGDGYRCGKSFWLPLADTASTVASVTWVVRANSELETHSQDSESDLWRASRIAGWAGIGLFGASAIYGYVVEARCASLRNAAEAAAAPPPPPPSTRPKFPGSVFGFGFRMRQAELAQLCLSKRGLWTMEGATGSCKPTLDSNVSPEIRVSFELGVPSEIRTRYLGSAQTKNRDYQALAAGLRASYGPPQVEAEALPPACQASLAECLESGVRPKGPVWHWPAGTIELVPSWASERAVLDIRYAREEVQAD